MNVKHFVGLAAATLVFLSGCAGSLPIPGAPVTKAGTGTANPASNPAAPPTTQAPAPTTQAPAPTTQAPAPPPAAPKPGGSVDVGTFVDQVSAASKEIKTYSMTMTMKTTMAGNDVTTTAKGIADVSDPAKKKMDMEMSVGGLKMHIIQIGDTMYTSMAGGKWAKQKSTSGTSAQTTADMFGQTKDAFKDVTYVGPETVNKVSMKHYKATIDGDKLGSSLGESGNLGTIKYDLWLDAKNYTRKIAMSFKGDNPTSMTMTMDDINKKVTIKAPI